MRNKRKEKRQREQRACKFELRKNGMKPFNQNFPVENEFQKQAVDLVSALYNKDVLSFTKTLVYSCELVSNVCVLTNEK